MSATESALSNEKALALRLIRTQSSPHDFWLWLSGLSSTPMDNIATWIDGGVFSSVKSIIASNLAEVDAREKLNLRESDAWIAAIVGFVHTRSNELKLSCGHPMTAASLLPLYRSLATRRLPEALEQTRKRLAEMLALVGIAEELGSEFLQVLQRRGAPVTSPYLILKSVLKLDLVSVGEHSLHFATAFNPGADSFDKLADLHATNSHSSQPELPWSDPQLLWQIAGELIAKKADIVLPRPWADVSIPWTAIGDHWNALTHRLSNSNLPASSTVIVADDETEEIEYNEDDEIVSEMIDDLLAMQTDVAEVKIGDSIADSTFDSDGTDGSAVESLDSNEGSSSTTNHNPSITGRAHASHGSIVGAPRMESDSEEETEDDDQYPETDSLDEAPIDSVPKIAIVEIASESDKLFVNLIRRYIATARNDDRTVCLVAICVESEDDATPNHASDRRSNGLRLWQERLVNWLADHPHIHEPLAFVTHDGQLVLSMFDAERSEATNIIREGLVKVLAGKQKLDQSSLACVPIPARYFSGIGSVTAPNASFAAEQLIAATWRCLGAAQSQGKATIKSIEVF